MMQLFWAPRTRSSRVVWLLEEAGVDYQRVEIGLDKPRDERSPELLSASPMGKVPALIDGDVKMADSAAIAIYIADRYPKANLAPALDSPLRGRYLYWMVYTPGVIEPAMSEKFSGAEPNRYSHGWSDFDTMIETLEAAVGPSGPAEGDELGNGPWLLGEAFSAADVLVGSSVLFLKQFNMLPDSPKLIAYAERCAARPGYQFAQTLEPPPQSS